MTGSDSERRCRSDALFRAHSRDIVAYCRWRLPIGGDVQDAVAEVFLAAWRRIDDVPESRGARIWLYATARRVMANQRRADRRRQALEEEVLHLTPPSAETEPELQDPADAQVREALRQLKPADREVLLLSAWEGLAPAEIATVMGCLTVTACSRLHRARTRFGAAFEELHASQREHEEEPSGARPRAQQPPVPRPDWLRRHGGQTRRRGRPRQGEHLRGVARCGKRWQEMAASILPHPGSFVSISSADS